MEAHPVSKNRQHQPQEHQKFVEVVADRLEYDERRKIVTLEGNAVVRFDGSVVDADRLQVNLDNLIAVGDGNVALTRGDQVLRGQRFYPTILFRIMGNCRAVGVRFLSRQPKPI